MLFNHKRSPFLSWKNQYKSKWKNAWKWKNWDLKKKKLPKTLSTAATVDKWQTEVVQTVGFGFLPAGTSLPEQLQRTILSATQAQGCFFFIISSGQVWRFCLSNFVSGSLQLEISVTAYLESSFFQGCVIVFRAVPQLSWIWFHQKPEWMIIIQIKIPLWDIRADVIGRQDNRIILLHRAVTSFLVRSLLVQHILLNWDVLLIRSLLRQSF